MVWCTVCMTQRFRVSQKQRGCEDRPSCKQPPPLISDHVCSVPTVVSARHISYLSPTQPSINRIAWKWPCCSFLLLFRGTATPGAWPLRLSRHGCPGGDARMGIVCTTRIHQEHRVQDWASHSLAGAPSQTQLRDGRCPDSVGRQGLKTCELMLWSFKPSQHAVHAQHSAAHICCVNIQTMPEWY